MAYCVFDDFVKQERDYVVKALRRVGEDESVQSKYSIKKIVCLSHICLKIKVFRLTYELQRSVESSSIQELTCLSF